MGPGLATLSINLIAQLAELQSGMDKAGRIAEKNAAQIEGRYKRLQGAMVGIGAALGAAFSVAGLTQFFRTTLDGLDALNDLNDATGASIENLSALEDIAARTGTGMDVVGDAIIKLNKALGDAKPNNAIGAAFKALNLDAAELKRIDPAEALRQVAIALNGYADDGNKARVVQELFGKSIKQVAPLLKDLAEGGELNATVTREQADAADKFNKQLAQFSKNATDASREIAGPLVTSLNDFFGALRRFGNNPGGFLAGVGEQLKVDYLRERLQGAKNEIERLTPDAERARGILQVQPDSIRAKATLADFAEMQRAAEDYRKEIDAIVFAGAKRRPANEGGGGLLSRNLPDIIDGKPKGGPKPSKPQEQEAFVFKLDDTTAAALKRLENTDTQKIAQLRLELQALIEIRAQSGAGSVDEAILDVEDALARLTPEGQAAAAAVERLNAILAQTPTTQMQEVLADVELINKAFAGTPELAEQWAEAIMVATQGLRKETEETTVELSEFARQAASNIQDALGDSVLATIEGNAGSIEDIWKNMLKRLVAQAAAAQLGKFLLGDSFGKTGQVGGAAGTFIDFLRGLGGGARAGGGPVSAGRPYLVGERGPELVVPRSSGTVVPNNALAGQGSMYQVVVQGDASENTLRLIRAALAQFEARQMARRGV